MRRFVEHLARLFRRRVTQPINSAMLARDIRRGVASRGRTQ